MPSAQSSKFLGIELCIFTLKQTHTCVHYRDFVIEIKHIGFVLQNFCKCATNIQNKMRNKFTIIDLKWQ